MSDCIRIRELQQILRQITDQEPSYDIQWYVTDIRLNVAYIYGTVQSKDGLEQISLPNIHVRRTAT